MAYEQYNVPLAGDILEDLAMAFREIIAKVCLKKYLQSKKNVFFIHHEKTNPVDMKLNQYDRSMNKMCVCLCVVEVPWISC